MTAKERITIISDLIYKDKKVSVSELSELCDVTEETIRKDLTKLELEGLLTRVHGGAILNEQKKYKGIHFIKRKDVRSDEKRTIARLVTPLIQNGNTLFADSSTTVSEALKLIPEELELTLVSNSTNIFLELASKNMHIISTGGEFNKKYLSLQGSVAKENIYKYNVNIALISCQALDMERGVQDSSEGEAEIKKLMINQAEKVILLADHTKFDRAAFVRIMDFSKVHYLVTDQKPNEAWIAYCLEHNIKLVY